MREHCVVVELQSGGELADMLGLVTDSNPTMGSGSRAARGSLALYAFCILANLHRIYLGLAYLLE